MGMRLGRSRRAAWGLLLAATVGPALPRVAHADPTKEEVARADTLFREAQQLVQKGQYSEGCAKFEESQHLDPANGTLLNLAFCHEKEGKFASAYKGLQELLGNVATSKSADDKERTRVANDRMKVLEKKITRVAFDISELPREVSLSLDGEHLNDPNLPLILDPGSHTVDATAVQKKPGKKTFEVKDPGPMTVKLDPLADDAPPPPPVVEKPPPPPPSQGGGFWSGRRIAGAVVAGVGLVGVGVGVGFGINTFQNRDLRDPHCSGTVCDSTGIFYHVQAENSATVSTIGFVAGGVLLGVGTVLFITAPRKAAAPPPPDGATARITLGVGPRAVGLRGTF
jgi:hypothetical protein